MYNIVLVKYNKNFVYKIIKDNYGLYKNPFLVYNAAETLRRLYFENNGIKIKFFYEKILTLKELNEWSINEYLLLNKCFQCGIINDSKFCSSKCVENYNKDINEKLLSEEECEYLR